jgi:hypothetical protein
LAIVFAPEFALILRFSQVQHNAKDMLRQWLMPWRLGFSPGHQRIFERS